MDIKRLNIGVKEKVAGVNNRAFFKYIRIEKSVFLVFKHAGIYRILDNGWLCVNNKKNIIGYPMYSICAPLPHIRTWITCMYIKKMRLNKYIIIFIILGHPYYVPK